MIEGLNSEIEFIWTDGLPRFAAFRNTDVSAPETPFQNTTDPNWVVRYRDTGAESEVEWLPYIADDGRLWRAKLHCQYTNPGIPIGGYIHTWFEHELNENGDDNHNEGFMFFLDWDRHPWEARLVAVDRPFPAQPKFILRRF